MSARHRASFPIYLCGLAAWFAASGIQTVLFPWLAAVVLGLPAAIVGVAQMVLMAPAMLLLLYAGAVSDRGNPRRILLLMHLAAALPPLLLAAAIRLDALSLGLLLVYGIAMGTIQAFIIPARDSILPQLAGDHLARAVALATGLQFASQLLGIGAAWLADSVGAPLLLVLQALVVALGALAVLNLPPTPTHPDAPSGGRFAAMREGLVAARRDQRVWPVLIVMVSIGVFYGGTFMVTIPIAVRDVYGRSADGIALANLAFWSATILTSFLMAGIARRLQRPGGLLVAACSYGVVVLALMGFLPDWPLMLAACFAWGLGAGITMTQGRTVVQSLAAPEMRGRMLALFQLGFLGGGPIGALLMGALTQLWGPGMAMWVAAVCMAAILLVLTLRSPIAMLRLHPVSGA